LFRYRSQYFAAAVGYSAVRCLQFALSTFARRESIVFPAAKVDELPQIYNVLKGEMSFVGPRPCLPTQTKLINERLLRGVYDAKPGITGFAQVRGLDMSSPEELAKSDQQYLNNLSMKQDLWLVVQTVFGRGIGDKTS